MSLFCLSLIAFGAIIYSVFSVCSFNIRNCVHGTLKNGVSDASQTTATSASSKPAAERGNWGNDVEFLMSCIAMSVGLGNVWRFPFTALANGGGAFLIPYLIVLLIIGRPLYYMEMLLGQFSSRSGIKVFDMVPALRGMARLSFV